MTGTPSSVRCTCQSIIKASPTYHAMVPSEILGLCFATGIISLIIHNPPIYIYYMDLIIKYQDL